MDIKKLFEDKQNQMLATFNLVGNISHSGEKGDATEEEWCKWFNDNFPKRYHAESGFVIDCDGNISQQIDIIIYDTHFSPIVFQVNGKKYFAAESVYAVFEVKQNLNKEHIAYAKEKIASVRKLKRTNGEMETIDGPRKKREPLPQIIGGLLTLRCEWVDPTISKHISENLNDVKTEEQIDFICALEKYACEIKYDRVVRSFMNKPIELLNVNVKGNDKNGTLIYTYFKLLRMLQYMGNVPAIDFSQYGIED